MEQAKKQRLVGGIVLAALALILVPAFLDFSRNAVPEVQRQEMPQAPDARRMEVLPLEVWSSKEDPQVDPDNRIMTEPSPVAEPVAEAETDVIAKPAASTPEHKPVQKAATKPEPEQKVASEPAPKPTSKPTVASKPDSVKLPVVPEGSAAWVVQIGSFGDEPKAFALRDRLREAGHPVFIERGRSNNKLIYRVKVGPMLQKSEAERRKQQVAKLTKLDGLVMKYR